MSNNIKLLLLFWIGFSKELTFSHLSEEDKKATAAGQLPQPPEPVVPTEGVEESATA